MKVQDNRLSRQGIWRWVFLQSSVNGAPYHGDQLPRHNWNWPKDTYLRRRLEYLRQFRMQNRRKLLWHLRLIY
jgi:hypothetical protein